jgi:hypothetical protein
MDRIRNILVPADAAAASGRKSVMEMLNDT